MANKGEEIRRKARITMLIRNVSAVRCALSEQRLLSDTESDIPCAVRVSAILATSGQHEIKNISYFLKTSDKSID